MTNPYLQKRSLQLSGHKTSVALETEFWQILEEMADINHNTLAAFIATVDTTRNPDLPLSSALRLTALKFVMNKP
ncbi:ribbon-helix-helix domain-containing protein [Commensalibacter oyaizuii]|uniref:Ribbon-helix-helix domain-containing protein n=1 Tax=Commensalibacter oyaizuii TaxID=3043873 RepID=A0ABT6Q3W0_9PROT|nr:ribbon-helix-helix domain-containing protein [Commensalibacter sp. TBRC 16381]MDI2091793.1 ribbon-helix-helix domain-containing protein [Commensalibacter sp. TBRC 16381]